MSSEVYRKVGRGGAGNFYSKQDIEDATKNQNEVSRCLSFLPHPLLALLLDKLHTGQFRLSHHQMDD